MKGSTLSVPHTVWHLWGRARPQDTGLLNTMSENSGKTPLGIVIPAICRTAQTFRCRRQWACPCAEALLLSKTPTEQLLYASDKATTGGTIQVSNRRIDARAFGPMHAFGTPGWIQLVQEEVCAKQGETQPASQRIYVGLPDLPPNMIGMTHCAQGRQSAELLRVRL